MLIVSLQQCQDGRHCRVIVHRASCCYILTSSPFVVSQSSSSSSTKNPSDLEGVNLTALGSISKRKAGLLPAGSQRAQKVARTNTTHRPGRSMKETEATSRMHDAFKYCASTTSPTSRKKGKVSLTRNDELVHSLLKPNSSTSTISSLSGCRDVLSCR